MSGWAGACFSCTGLETMLTMVESAPFAGSAVQTKIGDRSHRADRAAAV